MDIRGKEHNRKVMCQSVQHTLINLALEIDMKSIFFWLKEVGLHVWKTKEDLLVVSYTNR